jgi:predicted dehydrogenase
LKWSPRQAVLCAERYRAAYGFARAAEDWRELVADPEVEAVVIASPQTTHRPSPRPPSRSASRCSAKSRWAPRWTMPRHGRRRRGFGRANMVGFNYIRTPASQFARQLIAEGAIGEVTWFRGEHTEDFSPTRDACQLAHDGPTPTATMGDLSPHMINARWR